MRKNADFLPSRSVHWSTPVDLYRAFMDAGYIDPCPLHSTVDGLNIDYYKQKLFINPPFSDLDKWVDYALKQSLNGCSITILMPARTDTKYFHKLVHLNPYIYFVEGRLKFGGCDKKAPFPTILVSINPVFRISLYNYGTIDNYIKHCILNGG